MKTGISFCALLLAAFCAAGRAEAAGVSTGTFRNVPGPDPVSVVRQLIMPGVAVATAAVADAAKGGAAGARAQAALMAQLKERYPERAAPDLALVRVCMSLMLRVNNMWLKSPLGIRAYPGPSDLDRFAAGGRTELEKFSKSLGEGHSWNPLDSKNASDIVARELKKGINTLPLYRGEGFPKTPPLTPEEEKYFIRPAR